MDGLEVFLSSLHPSAILVSKGTATVHGRVIPAAVVRTLYGQEIIWGMFSVERGKFKGRLANDAATEGVRYSPLPPPPATEGGN